MRGMTGIELADGACVLVRARPGRDAMKVSAVQLVTDAGEMTLPMRFPKRASVVLWGLAEGASLEDAAVQDRLAPLVRAGFRVEEVLKPAEALAVLARVRAEAGDVVTSGAYTRMPREFSTQSGSAQMPRGWSTGETAAWVAINREGAAIAMIDEGESLYSREISWQYRPGATPREELLQRYLLVAHLALELRHGRDVIRQKYDRTVDAIVTCGNLPDLRSLTMPLIEEFDLEVETLDALEGLELPPALSDEVVDKAPALQLACAAVASLGGRMREPSRAASWLKVAALAVVIAGAAWLVVRYAGSENRMASARPGPAVTDDSPPVRTAGSGGAAAPAAQPASAPEARAQRTPPPPPDNRPYPAATTGRSSSVAPAPRDARIEIPEATKPRTDMVPGHPTPPPRVAPRSQATAVRAPSPLKEPLPIVNSIVVAPGRRLAVLDGIIVREGEPIGPRILIRIDPDAVLLREPSGLEVRVPMRRGVEKKEDQPGIDFRL